jgi:uncharacterized RDD family membrane protein YckC
MVQMSQSYEQAPPAPDTAPADGPSGPRAGFWRRFAAKLIDGLILSIVDVILAAIFSRGGVYYGLSLIINYGYYTYMEGRPQGQTLGKMALGIRVYDFARGGPIGYGRAFVRQIAQILSAVVLLLGYLWMLWDREKQTWHDKIAGSVVVPVDAYR